MSVQGDITDYLKAAGPTGTPIPFDARAVAEATGHPIKKVHSTVYNLTSRGYAIASRGENGRDITALTFSDQKLPATRAARTTTSTPAPVGRIRTPELDLYLQAKAEAKSLTERFGGYVTVTFEEDALAEEAVLLQRAHGQQEATITDLRHALKEAKDKLASTEADLSTLRRQRNAKMVQDVADTGTGVIHSS